MAPTMRLKAKYKNAGFFLLSESLEPTYSFLYNG